MKHSDAVAFLRPALGSDPEGVWADFGAGRGTFTGALAALLDPDGRILAVDSADRAVRALERLAADAPEGWARIVPVKGDLRRLDAVPALDGVELDGAVLANVLHFVADPTDALTDVARRVRPTGRIVVIEYEGRRSSPWIPHPLSFDRLGGVAARAGLDEPRRVGTRDSAYRGTLYCAALGPASRRGRT